MKRTPLKRGIKLMKRSGFKIKLGKPLKRSKLNVVGHSDSSVLKREIQSTLRDLVIIRDGGCILRNYPNEITPQYRECGGYRNDGELILQAEHLETRSNAASFADSRLVVCLCQRHHIYYKPQHADEYYRLVKKHIGKMRTFLLERVQQDRTPHKADLKLELIALKRELKSLQVNQERA